MNGGDFLTACLYALPILAVIAALVTIGVWLDNVLSAKRVRR